MLLECTQCASTNRIPSLPKKRIRCGKCQRLFTPQDLLKARIEPPPPKENLGLSDDDLIALSDILGC